MRENSPTIDEILSSAIDLPADARDEYLRQTCGDDEDKLAECLSLLAAYETSGDFLEQPLGIDVADLASEEDDWVGRSVANFTLIELLGSGGMGRVYLAQREEREFKQRVAVKLIQRGIMAEEVQRRFRNECRILASLEHPNIARLIDGGTTEDDLLYIVMEYVDGLPIDRYCEELKLSVEARLELFRDVCLAVHVVHQHSTIHRDIKPENILVSREGQVKLVDFGIARVLEAADEAVEHTAVGLSMMTPLYASPEQIRNQPLTTATDVYSLGAVLYKVLTGVAPFSHVKRRELADAITEREATRPSDAVRGAGRGARRLERKLRGDIDTIVLMALRTDPDRRYASVQAFSEDISRLLSGQPVSARPDTPLYRTGKFVRRNAAAVAVALLLAVLLVGTTILSLTLYQRAERARTEAIAERAVASRERNVAVSTTEFLQGLLASVNPALVDGRLDITVREVLDEASRRLETDLVGQAEVAASLHFVLGRSYSNLGEYEDAERHLEQAIAMRRSLDPPDEPGILASHVAMGQMRVEQGKYAEAESLLVAALPEHPERSDPAAVSELYAALSRVCSNLSRLDEAEAHARSSIEFADHIDDPQHVMHAQSRSELGIAFHRRGLYREAVEQYAESVEVAARTVGERHIITGQCRNNLGVGLGMLGRTKEAIVELEAAIAIYEAAYPADHPEFGTAHLNLADQYSAIEDYQTARGYYRLARAELAASHGDEYVMVALAINGQAHCDWKVGNLEQARDSFEDAVARLKAVLGDDHPWFLVVCTNLARVQLELGNSSEARRLAQAALAGMQENLPEGHHHVARPLGVLVQLELEAGDVDAALAHAQEAADICASSLEEDHPDRMAAEERLAQCLELSVSP